MVGPGSATDDAIATFDTTTGKLIQNTTAILTAGTLTSTFSTANTNTPATSSTFNMNSTGTASAGFGNSLIFGMESSTTNARQASRITTLWTDATDADRSSAINFYATAATAEALVLRLEGQGNPAVNYVTLSSAGADNSPLFNATGSDTNIDLRFRSKGSGAIIFEDENATPIARGTGVASAVNNLTFTNSATGQNPILAATGADGTIDLELAPKGANGAVATTTYKSFGTAFASLGTPDDGTFKYCSNCTVTSGASNVCTSGGTGALAVRLNGAWRCFNAQN
mgnify:FL=1